MLILFFLLLVNVYTETQGKSQIVQDVEKCEINITNGIKHGNPQFKQFKVPSYVSVENYEMQVLFSLCGKIPIAFPNNGSCRNACIYNKRTKSLITSEHNLAVPYKEETSDATEIVVQLLNKLKCSEDENYDIKVKMVANPGLKNPRLVTDQDQCVLEIEMLKPDYEPPCTILLNTKELIDFRTLKGKAFSVPWEKEEFKISLCGSVRECGFDAAGCRIGNDTLVLGETKTQRFAFDQTTNELKVVASIKEGRKKARNIEVDVKCNWKIPYFSNPKFIPAKPQQGRRYKFEVESSFGCIKFPTNNCLIVDGNNDFSYNLRSLSNKNGVKVQTKGSKYILLNICGTLSTKGPKGNDCDSQYSQSCEVDGTSYTNKGSIPYLEIKRDSLKIGLKNGGRCNENQTYSTEVEILCSRSDKGPEYLREEGCVTKILWETPKACPKLEKQTDGCSLSIPLGDVNLSELYGEDRTQSLSASETFKYNICGNMHSNCSSYSNATACYINGENEQVIGWNSPKLEYSNGKLVLSYFGDKCPSNNKSSSLTINMLCSFADNGTKPDVRRTDSCSFVASVRSQAACFSKEVKECRYEREGWEYDLTPLMAKEENYEVKDDVDGNVTYFLNVCGPLLNEPGLAISANSMVYKQDKWKPHIMDRFISLGSIAGPKVSDGKLQIYSSFAHICDRGIYYTSIIFFECSTEEEKPKLLKKSSCTYEFIWKTKYACSKIAGTCSVNANNTSIILPSRDIEIDRQNATYTFNMCSDDYKVCTSDSCITNKLVRQPGKLNGKSNIELELNDPGECTDNLPLNKVFLTVQCDPRQEDMSVSIVNSRNCRMNLNVRTKIVCRNDDMGKLDRGLRVANNEKTKIISRNNKEDLPSSLPNIKTIKEAIQQQQKDEDKDKYESENTIIKNNETIAKIDKEEDNKHKYKNENSVIENNETIIKDDEQKISEVTNTATKVQNNKTMKENDHLNIVEESHYQRCDSIGLRSKKFNLKDIKSSEIRSKNTYLINFDGSFPNCGGTICKNGVEILPFVKNCPVVSYEEDYVKLSYSMVAGCLLAGNGTLFTNPNNLVIEIHLKCNESSQLTSLVEDSYCKISFDHYSQEFCDLLTTTKTSTIYGILTVVLVILLALGLLIFAIYRKNYCKKCSYVPVGGRGAGVINHSKLL